MNSAVHIAPLVEPVAELSEEQKQRFARHITLPGIGVEGQKRLANAKVLCIGAGGLGSPILLYLAAAGVGTLGIIDDDVVDASNLQRQVIHGEGQLGEAKVKSARQAIKAQNSDIAVIGIPQHITADNALDIISGFDVVVDGSDNFATRYIVNDACEALEKPLIWGTISQFTAQVSLFWGAYKTLEGATKTGPTLRDLYPDIPPVDSVPTCAVGGVLGALCGTVGSVMATETIKLICGLPELLLGKLWMYDARTQRTRLLTFEREEGRAPIPLKQTLHEIQAAQSTADHEPVPEIALSTVQANHADYVLIDVRESEEREGGHYTDGAHMPHHDLIEQIESGENIGEILNLNRYFTTNENRSEAPAQPTPVVYCASGVRSAKVVRAALDSNPDQPIFSLKGGYSG